ncbi:hypothetical protein [Mycolicibacterium confluentis]|uniref:Uncharacterized protein n=1 Tax=Mycolicibacterium confluentis TaxID=28047 RepID=A0A7I7Y5E6_9MYCO|nr:hypothetical protein [Mycolicibacterium confluentis]BBZ36131.1 hypothetical protein MCNF_47360 [Mycolicibacterium confluentis]
MTAVPVVQDEPISGPADGNSLKYQLAVLAPSVADAVAYSGGWLFDRVMAGWEVSVLIPGLDDASPTVRPLEILGARAYNLDVALESACGLRPDAIAVAADIFTGDRRVNREVTAALRRRSVEVSFWGDMTPASVSEGTEVEPVEHPLTAAARAFKSHALALASAASGAVGRTEKFFAIGTPHREW